MITVVTQKVGLLKNLSLLGVYKEVKTTKPVWCWCSLNLQKILYSKSLKQVLRSCITTEGNSWAIQILFQWGLASIIVSVRRRWLGALLLTSANVLKGWLCFVRIFTPEKLLEVFRAHLSLSWVIVFVLLMFWWGFFSQEEISEMSQKWQEVWNERICLWIS